MVNPGAIATTSLVPGPTPRPAGLRARGPLALRRPRASRSTRRSTRSASETNHRNRELAGRSTLGRLGSDPGEAVDLYTRQCCLSVTARDLAVMGATLADGGVNPLTHERVVSAETCRHALAVMTTAGLYETSGDWLYDVGLPGKSGIGGGIVDRRSRARAGSARSRPGSTRRATASRASSPRGFLSQRARPRPVRLGAGRLTGRRGRIARRERAAPPAPARRRGGRARPRADGGRRPRRRDGARRAVSRPSSASSSRRRSAGRASRTSRWTSTRSSDDSTVALRGPLERRSTS